MRALHKALIVGGLVAAVSLLATTIRGAAAQPLPTGLLVPLYIYPSPGAWDPLLQAKRASPNVPIAAIVNPANGPGTQADPNYVMGIAYLRAAGILVYAYVAANYGGRSTTAIFKDIDNYRAFYGTVFDGLFIDQMDTNVSSAIYYGSISSYFKQNLGPGLVVGNPGNDIPKSFLGMAADVFVIYEGAGLPSVGYLDGWHAQYAKQTWATLSHDTPLLDAGWEAQAKNYVGLLYATADAGYNAFPPYLNALLAGLP